MDFSDSPLVPLSTLSVRIEGRLLKSFRDNQIRPQLQTGAYGLLINSLRQPTDHIE